MNILLVTTIPVPELEKVHSVKYYNPKEEPLSDFTLKAQKAHLIIEQETSDNDRLTYTLGTTFPWTCKALWAIDTYLRGHEIISYGNNFHHIFCADTQSVHKYEQPSSFLPLCANNVEGTSGFTKDMYRTRDVELGFAGFKGNWKPKRNHYIEKLIDKYGTRFHYVNGLKGNEYNDFYNRVKIAWNCAPTQSVNLRVFETMLAGCLVITDRNSDTKMVFTDGENIVMYDNPKDCIDKIEYYLQHWDTEGVKIAQAGKELVESQHMRYHRYFEMIDMLINRGLVPSEHPWTEEWKTIYDRL